MSKSLSNVPASIRQRLLNLSRERREDFQRTLDRFTVERFLYRSSESAWSEQFLLKGAMLFLTWSDSLHRPTRDLDLLGFGSPDIEVIQDIFREIAKAGTEDDGIPFNPDSVNAAPIREDALYDGIRVRMSGNLSGGAGQSAS